MEIIRNAEKLKLLSFEPRLQKGKQACIGADTFQELVKTVDDRSDGTTLQIKLDCRRYTLNIPNELLTSTKSLILTLFRRPYDTDKDFRPCSQ